LTTVVTLRINEEYASLVPKISDSEYEPIKQDIKEHGQHVPIVINRKSEILDGLTRNRICQELGIEPRTVLCPGEYEDPLLAKQFIININRNRRHLNDFQKGEIYYKLYQYETEIEARRRQLAGTLVSHDDN
jgi:ParB-like chromosome segregation protein Spo0J